GCDESFVLFCLFFFSSRRRHTRFSRDWSSDVCSSDLYRTGEEGTTTEYFKQLLHYAKEEKVDLIALSGDIFNYPSQVAVAFVKEQLDQTGLPYMYTAGNHDWHYEGMEGSADELRDYWCKKSLAPLYSSGIYASSQLVGEV